MEFVNIGFGNLVNAGRVISVVSPESAPVKRMIQEAKSSGSLIDATHGRKTRSFIITDSGHVVLSYLDLKQIAQRFGTEGEDQ